MKTDYLFGEVVPFQEGDEVAPNMTVKRVLRCINCVLPDRFLDSIYCAEKRYWIEENPNYVISHCMLFEIPENEDKYLKCEKSECKTCKEKCINNTTGNKK